MGAKLWRISAFLQMSQEMFDKSADVGSFSFVWTGLLKEGAAEARTLVSNCNI